MKLAHIIFVASIVLSIVSCHKSDQDDDANPVVNPTDTTTLPPVETRPKVAPNQQPVFEGQTRVPGIQTQADIQVSTFATGLNRPSGLAFMPNGNIIISERPGSIRIVTSSGSVGSTIANVPAVRAQGDGGLLDVKLDLDFASTRLVFWSYVEPSAGNTGTNCIARARLSDDETAFENVTVIYRGTSPYTGVNHNGSRMLFDNNGLLYCAFGERFDNGIRVQAQELNSSLGKIIRINKDGSAAAGNPYLNTPDARPEIYSLGHRNPQGLAFNPVTGELWESEHGPQAGDEINIINPGNNYGWPVISYGLEYNGSVVGNGTQQSGMEQPIYYWDPAIAPSGMIFYTGSLIPEWQNNLFVAALAGTHIIRLVLNNTTHRVIKEERLLSTENRRIRHLAQGSDGAIYAITDETNGRIYRIGI